jgi:hypothetical protein
LNYDRRDGRDPFFLQTRFGIIGNLARVIISSKFVCNRFPTIVEIFPSNKLLPPKREKQKSPTVVEENKRKILNRKTFSIFFAFFALLNCTSLWVEGERERLLNLIIYRIFILEFIKIFFPRLGSLKLVSMKLEFIFCRARDIVAEGDFPALLQ